MVLDGRLDQDCLRKVSNRFGYRYVSFSHESLTEAIEIATDLFHRVPKYSRQLPRVSDEEAYRIYELMRKVDAVFTKHQITYWATGGTLIGAVRYAGLMPWDDDLDLCIMEQDEEKLVRAKEDLEALGLGVYKKDIYVIYFQDGIPVKDLDHPGACSFKYPSLDVFVMALEPRKEAEDRYVHRAPYFYSRFGTEDGFSYAQIEEISRVPFGPLMLPIPGEAAVFLNNNYGTAEYPDLWRVYTKESTWSHKLGEPTTTPGVAFVLVDDFSPAPYIGD